MAQKKIFKDTSYAIAFEKKIPYCGPTLYHCSWDGGVLFSNKPKFRLLMSGHENYNFLAQWFLTRF
jgi:hypothetical protein